MACQALALVFSIVVMRVPMSWSLWSVIVGVAAGSNLLLQGWIARGQPGSERLMAAVLLLDVGLLTLLLNQLGGTGSPFSALYLVQVTLASVVLGKRWTWVLAAAAVAGYGSLFLIFPRVQKQSGHAMEHFPGHLEGMWVALSLTAILIAYFVGRISSELKKRDQAIVGLERRAALNEKLASLSTLAAGAAHELGTPLSTIALISKELARTATTLPSPLFLEDVEAIRREVDRCRDILQQMSASAGQAVGEWVEHISLPQLIERVWSALPEAHRPRIDLKNDCRLETLKLPVRTFVQTLVNLIRNALEAGPGTVTLSVVQSDLNLEWCVEDRGVGMSKEMVERVGEPFLTTRSPGKGLGLGVFLSRAVVDRMGGSLRIESTWGVGTRALIALPLESVQ